MTRALQRPGVARRTREGELGITYGCLGWLEKNRWPQHFPEVGISRGLGRGLVDVGAARNDFSETCAIEVKIAFRPGEAEAQLLDARRAADFAYLAAPREVWRSIRLPETAGVLEPLHWPPRGREGLHLELREVRKPARTKPDPDARKAFLHSIIRQALKRGPLPPDTVGLRECPACHRNDCDVWPTAARDLDLDDLERSEP